MSALEWPLWMILGAGTAYLFLRTQKWSVQRITPEKPALSQVLILGGMLLRWLMIALVLVLAFQRSAPAGLIVFVSFMIVRLVILAFWDKQWRLTTAQTNSQKD